MGIQFIGNSKAALDAAYAGVAELESESLRRHSPAGDGITDDTPAFAAALAAAPSGGVVTVPPATTAYLLGTVLQVNKPVTFRAPQGATVTLSANERISIRANDIRFEGFTFVKGAAMPWANLLQTRTTPVNQHTGIRFERCKFDGVSLRCTKIGALNADGTSGGTGTDVLTPQIISCEFTAYAEDYPLELVGTKDALVERSWFHDYGLDSTKGEGVKARAGYGTRILNNIFENATRDGVDIFDSNRVTVTGNTFRNCPGRAIDSKWRSDGANDVRLNIIANNRADNCGGFNLDVRNTLVQGNQAIGCEMGFRASNSIDSDFGGTNVPTTYVAFVDNLAKDCTGDGFSLGTGDGMTVVGNIAIGNAGWGFNGTPTNTTLVGNVAMGNTLGGIDAGVNTKGCVLIGNMTQDTTGSNATAALPNTRPYYGRTVSGSLRELVKVSASDELVLGETGFSNMRAAAKLSLDKIIVHKRATQTLAANGAVTIDASAANVHEVTLNANATSTTINNGVTGQQMTVTFIQDATGGRTYAWPTSCKFAGNTAPSDTTPSTRTSVTFQSLGTSTWREVSRAVAVPA